MELSTFINEIDTIIVQGEKERRRYRMSSFTDRLKSLMTQYSVSQKNLSEYTGISEASLSRYVSGVLKPRYDVLEKIAKFFKVSTSYLIGETENAEKNDPYEETISIVARNKAKLSTEQKAELIKVLLGDK